MKTRANKDYYLGLDIGTDSVGYAVTDTSPEYKLLKYSDEPMWGVHLFDAASTKAERRGFRTARRRLDRRQQRVDLVQELFAEEIAKTDPLFYNRIKESALLRTDAREPYCLFNDKDYSDKDYHKEFPTIHHLICALMNPGKSYDARLVYIACAWLVAHRGHFLSEISLDNIDKVTDFASIYERLMEYFKNLSVENYQEPWKCESIPDLANALKIKAGITYKTRLIGEKLFPGGKIPKGIKDPDSFPFNVELIIKLLAGSTVKLKDLFGKDEYAELEQSSVSLGMDDEKLGEVLRSIGDDGELIIRLKEIYDWEILSELLNGKQYISESKVEIFEQHKEDLKNLKSVIRKYAPDQYGRVFRRYSKENYVAYSGNVKNAVGDVKDYKKTNDLEEFGAFVKKIIEKITPEPCDAEIIKGILTRIESGSFMPKQVTGDNRVIPYQLYYVELDRILETASTYLPFLLKKDEDGLAVKDKLLSVMSFRIPYFVGPLNGHSIHSWIERKSEGRILPWNFEEKVDLDASEQRFIQRMLNKCTYLPGCDVLPKHALLYEKFEVLNEINKIRINDVPISTELKQSVFNDLFMQYKNVTPKAIKKYLVSRGYCSFEDVETMKGLDETVKASLSSHIAFRKLMNSGALSQDDVENIILRIALSEDARRLKNWLSHNYPNLDESDVRYVASLKIKEFGRMSGEFLSGIEGSNVNTGETDTIIGFMWNHNVNMMELMSGDYSFVQICDDARREYYSSSDKTLDERLDDMYISNSVKRPIIRTLDVVKDVVKANGCAPKKIFVEMARGGDPDSKGKRTKSRKDQLLELYSKVKDEDIKRLREQLDSMGDTADNRLQSEALFLYYLQLGRCMYSGEPIDIEKLGDGTYNVDHIYPQSKVKDDSILNNKVLVLSGLNMTKGDDYPLPSEWRIRMHSFWRMLKDAGLMNDEKFDRLTRRTPFSAEEEWGFINRQLVETRQSTIAITVLLKEKYPDTEVVFVKAGLVSSFRQEFGCLKSREINDLHHAKDAYLNIVCGNVYHERFTKRWFDSYVRNNPEAKYSINTKTLFTRKQTSGSAVLWEGSPSLTSVLKSVKKSSVHLTHYSYVKKGGLFDQQPLSAREGLIPLKQGLPTEQYGGYNKPSNACFILVSFVDKKKKELMLLPVEVMRSAEVFKDKASAELYAIDKIYKINGKKLSEVDFPIGLRVIKVRTVFSFDGFRCLLSGSSGGGRCVIMAPFMPLLIDYESEQYIKALESFEEKIKKNDKIQYDGAHSVITPEKNRILYNTLKKKYTEGFFSKRWNPPTDVISSGETRFATLSVKEQVTVLLQIIRSFGRSSSSGVDLTGINGASRAGATVNVSSLLSNWAKKYESAVIVDTSSSGLWEKESANLFDLL